MVLSVLFVLLGYLSGSVLYARLFAALFGKKDIYKNSADRNPGTANAFKYGGFWCGTLTLIFDLAKGFLPVFLYLRLEKDFVSFGLPFVLSAPVIGHAFPLFYKFRGGKGIATTFGCLLGLFPYGVPVCIFAGAFIFFSIGIVISPNYYRTIGAYLATAIVMVFFKTPPPVWFGYLIATGAVCIKLLFSKEEKERLEVRLLWKR